MLPPPIRQNAFNSIFTTKSEFVGFLDNKSNNFSKDDKKLYNKLAEYIFDSNDKSNYKKVCYLRDNDIKIHYILANIYEDFKFGSPSLWKLFDISKKDKRKELRNNKFNDCF